MTKIATVPRKANGIATKTVTAIWMELLIYVAQVVTKSRSHHVVPTDAAYGFQFCPFVRAA